MTCEPTMAAVWLTLSHQQRQELADMMGVSLPVLSLTIISKVMLTLIDQRLFMNCKFDKSFAVTGDRCSIMNCTFEDTVTLYGNSHSLMNNVVTAKSGNAINIQGNAGYTTFSGTTQLGGHGGIVIQPIIEKKSPMKELLHPMTLAWAGIFIFVVALTWAAYLLVKF